jgi:hypothetical protein
VLVLPNRLNDLLVAQYQKIVQIDMLVLPGSAMSSSVHGNSHVKVNDSIVQQQCTCMILVLGLSCKQHFVECHLALQMEPSVCSHQYWPAYSCLSKHPTLHCLADVLTRVHMKDAKHLRRAVQAATSVPSSDVQATSLYMFKSACHAHQIYYSS